jgi:type I restriction enzyme S subunit
MIDKFAFDAEALLVSGNGANVGYVHYYKGKFNAYQRTYVLTDFGASIKYIQHYMTEHLADRIRVEVKAGNTPYITMGTLTDMKVPLPPTRFEQDAIAEALSDADALIESLEQLIAKKRAIKQGAMQELLTGKRRLPGNKGQWETKAFGELFAFSGGISASRDQLSSEGHCYLHYGDIHTSTMTYVNLPREAPAIPRLNVPLQKVSKSALLEDGDVVFVDASEDEEGTSKHVVIANPDGVPFISGLHTIVAKSRSQELDNLFKRYCFQSRKVRNQFRFYAVGTKVSGVSKTNIAKIELTYPNLNEQAAIAAILSDMEAEIEELEAKLAKARQVKEGMLQELLTGRIRLV